MRYRRNRVEGGSYFFTVALADRGATTLTTHVDALRESFRVARAARPFVIEAIVILPEHLHALMTLPPDDSDFPVRWRAIKAGFTHRLASRGSVGGPDRKGRYRVWQARFWEHTIRDEEDFIRHVDYIHYNPVKHGHVTRTRDWPHSSFHRYVRDGSLPMDWGDDVSVPAAGFGEPG